MDARALRWLVALATLGTACAPEREAARTAPPPEVPAAGPSTSIATPVPPPPLPPPVKPPPELPRGGRTIFPDYQLVGFCGTPGAPALGPLLDHPGAKAEKLLSYANQYTGGRKVLPVFELVAVVVQAGAGADGKYRARVFDSVVDEYLQAARDSKGLLLLNIQPGQSDFLSEVQRFERYLHEPDVGVALDPEWAMLPKQNPGHFYGQTNGDAINAVIAYLSGIVTRDGLPEKALVFHKVNNYVVKDEATIAPAPGVAVIKSIDGYGNKAVKANTYVFLIRNKPPWLHPGFKLFFDEDRQNGGALMSPAEVMKLEPRPEYVMYE